MKGARKSLKRPRNPTGFVRPHPDTKTKRWQGIVKYPDLDKPGQWKSRSQTFERKADAQAWVDETLSEHRKNPAYKPPSDEGFATFVSRWLNDVAKIQVRETTWNAYYYAVQPALRLIGDKPLKHIAPLDIQGVYTSMIADGIKPATIRITHNVCRQALDAAVDYQMIPVNPVHRVKPPRVPKPVVHPPTPVQARALLHVADNHMWKTLWYMIALTGCRRGEALGLQWGDIDWTGRTLTIQRTLAGKAARRQIHEPKTASGRRVVAGSKFLMDLLNAHQHQQKLVRIAAGADWVETGFIFTTRTGKPLDGDNVRRAFKKLLKVAGLDESTRIHDLRHAMATTWLAQGVPVKVVSERLGHASIAITLQLYGHVLPNMQSEAAEQMDRWLLDNDSLPDKGSRTSPRRHHET